MASRWAAGLGLVAGVAALAAGGIAVGLELEQRLVNKRIQRPDETDEDTSPEIVIEHDQDGERHC